jgi:hypothetical protein
VSEKRFEPPAYRGSKFGRQLVMEPHLRNEERLIVGFGPGKEDDLTWVGEIQSVRLRRVVRLRAGRIGPLAIRW